MSGWISTRNVRILDRSETKVVHRNSLNSIHHAAKVFEGLARQRVARLDRQCSQKLFAGAIDQALGEISASQIEMRKVPWIISLCRNRLLQPGNRFVKAYEPDQVGADIVVGIAELRIDLDGAFAFGDRLLDLSLEVERPAQKGVRLGSGVQVERSPVKLDGAIIVALHLCLVRFLQLLPGLRLSIRRHD